MATSRGVLPLPPRLWLGQCPNAVRQGWFAVRWWHESRLGLRGNKPFAIERLVWTGKVPFEIHEMRAKPDGFELTFTKPVDPVTAGKVDSYQMKTFTYIYQAAYGSPEVDATTPKITKVVVGQDGKSVRLYVDGLQEGHIHDLTAAGVRSRRGPTVAARGGVLHAELYSDPLTEGASLSAACGLG